MFKDAASFFDHTAVIQDCLLGLAALTWIADHLQPAFRFLWLSRALLQLDERRDKGIVLGIIGMRRNPGGKFLRILYLPQPDKNWIRRLCL